MVLKESSDAEAVMGLSATIASSILDNQEIHATLFGGALSGIVGRTLLHPIDTVKAVIQVHIRPKAAVSPPDTSNNMREMLRRSYRNDERHVPSETYGKSTSPNPSVIPKAAAYRPALEASSRAASEHYFMGKAKSSMHFFSMFHYVYKTQGLRGLYRGYGLTVVGSVPGTCLYFTAYEVSKLLISTSGMLSPSSFACDFVSGFMAETISCIFWVPIDVCKERIQAQSELNVSKYKNGTDALRQIIVKDGVRQLYKGYGAALASFGPFSAFYFMFYQKCKNLAAYLDHKYQRNRKIAMSADHEAISATGILLSAAAAGMAAAFITTPLDVVKLRIQVQRQSQSAGTMASTPFLYKNFAHGLRVMLHTEGIRGLFRGATARMLFHTPNAAITLTLMEKLREWYLTNNSGRRVPL